MQNWQLMRDGQLDKETFVQRARILDLMREWFRKEGFLEVETPLMVKHPGMEPHLNLFSSEFVSEDGQFREKRYLHTSPEYSMKKLLGTVARGAVRSEVTKRDETEEAESEKSQILSDEASDSPFELGFEKIFQITKVFRNGEFFSTPQPGGLLDSPLKGGEKSDKLGCLHNPEFTMLEWYRANAGYLDIMQDTEDMIKFISKGLWENNSPLTSFFPSLSQKRGSWERLSVREAFQKYAKLNLDELRDIEDFRAAIEQKSYTLNTAYSWDDLFFLVLLNEIEPHLGKEKPLFLYDYPASQAALANKKNHSCEASGGASPCKGLGVGECDAFYAERFELYINGVELCNAFGELVDPVEQRQRLKEEQALRKEMGKEVYPIDEAFLEALETMPPSGGNALGIDRLVMVLLGKKSIEEVLLFPFGDVS